MDDENNKREISGDVSTSKSDSNETTQILTVPSKLSQSLILTNKTAKALSAQTENVKDEILEKPFSQNVGEVSEIIQNENKIKASAQYTHDSIKQVKTDLVTTCTSNSQEKLTRIRKKFDCKDDILNIEKDSDNPNVNAELIVEQVDNKDESNKLMNINDIGKNVNKEYNNLKNEVIRNEENVIYEEIELIVEEIIEYPTAEEKERSENIEVIDLVGSSDHKNKTAIASNNSKILNKQNFCDKSFNKTKECDKPNETLKVYVNKKKLKNPNGNMSSLKSQESNNIISHMKPVLSKNSFLSTDAVKCKESKEQDKINSNEKIFEMEKLKISDRNTLNLSKSKEHFVQNKSVHFDQKIHLQNKLCQIKNEFKEYKIHNKTQNQMHTLSLLKNKEKVQMEKEIISNKEKLVKTMEDSEDKNLQNNIKSKEKNEFFSKIEMSRIPKYKNFQIKPDCTVNKGVKNYENNDFSKCNRKDLQMKNRSSVPIQDDKKNGFFENGSFIDSNNTMKRKRGRPPKLTIQVQKIIDNNQIYDSHYLSTNNTNISNPSDHSKNDVENVNNKVENSNDIRVNEKNKYSKDDEIQEFIKISQKEANTNESIIIDQEFTKNSDLSSIKKRKRGRPPKSDTLKLQISSENNTKKENDKNDIGNSSSSIETIPNECNKNKNLKNNDENLEAESNRKNSVQSDLTKKRRGRPSKSDIIHSNVSIDKSVETADCSEKTEFLNLDNTQQNNTYKDNLDQNHIPKKRRGRPSRSDIINLNALNEKDVDLNDKIDDEKLESSQTTIGLIENELKDPDPSHLPKRRRGRPSRSDIINLNALNEKNMETADVNDKIDNEKLESSQTSAGLIGNELKDPENADQSHVLKRRRGRPSRSDIINFNASNEKNMETADIKDKIDDEKLESSQTSTGLIGNELKDPENADQSHVLKRRRGRPSKSDITHLNISKEKDPETADINDIIDREKLENSQTSTGSIGNDLKDPESSDQSPLPKKRRGRPSKSDIIHLNVSKEKDAETADINDIIDNNKLESSQKSTSLIENDLNNLQKESFVENNLPKKRRGRPSCNTKIINSNVSIINDVETIDSNSQIDHFNLENSQKEEKDLNDEEYSKKNYLNEKKEESNLTMSNESQTALTLTCSQETVVEHENTLKSSVSDNSLHKQTVDCENTNDEESSSEESDCEMNMDLTKKRKYNRKIHKNRKRGRPKRLEQKVQSDSDYIPHHSHTPRTSKIKEIKNSTSSEVKVNKIVKCGKCEMEVIKSQWMHHNLSVHNDLGWLDGTEKPNFENDEKLFKKVLSIAIKKRRGSLICESCNIVKRSVLGFISHITFCGKDEEEIQALMITCPECKAVVKPSSFECHERAHKMRAEENKKIINTNMAIENIGPKVKRKAAENATAKISEFTALVKDEKDNLHDKQMTLSFKDVKKIIKKPELVKRISSVILKQWKKDLDDNKSASCNQVGCQFTSQSLDEMKQHYSTCNFTPQENFVCKICQYQSLCENDIIKHGLENHPTEDNDDSNISMSDTESTSSEGSFKLGDTNHSNQSSVKKITSNGNTEPSNKTFKFLKTANCHTKYNKSFFAALQWTLDFEIKNYKFDLFKEFIPNSFNLLNAKDMQNYMPELEESMPTKAVKAVKQGITETEWKKWKRFEGYCIDDNPTFFTGGPVWAMAWLPIPTSLAFCENISEYIAISTHPTMDEEYSVGKSHSGKNIIQIWKLGNLNHQNESQNHPELAYAIAHTGGTVWSLEWCPSGCYENESIPGFVKQENKIKRMGMLAAACSDGCIRIYTLVFPEDLPMCNKNCENGENRYPIYHTEPSLILVINLKMYDNNEQTWQVTKLSWTKESGHNIIVAGYSNGYVALWDLSTKSSLTRFKRGDTTFIVAYRHFFAHHHSVTMVHLVPADNNRFLATASLDRLYKFWDLEDTSNPKQSFKKSFITDGTWLNNWCCAFFTFDDALCMNHNYVYSVPLREYTYKYYNILPMNSTSYSVAASDFGNSIATGTLAGEVLAIFPHQLLYFRNMEKVLHQKRYISVVSSIDIVDFDKDDKKSQMKNDDNQVDSVVESEYNYMPSTYKDSKNRFGLKFCDKMSHFKSEWSSENRKFRKRTLTVEMMNDVPIEQYPFMSANRVSWNPNAWSFLWLAVGYQNGFVRLIPFKMLASTSDWNKMLSKHLEKMKSEAMPM